MKATRHLKWIALEDEDGGRVRIGTLETGLFVTPNQVVTTEMVEVAADGEEQ